MGSGTEYCICSNRKKFDLSCHKSFATVIRVFVFVVS